MHNLCKRLYPGDLRYSVAAVSVSSRRSGARELGDNVLDQVPLVDVAVTVLRMGHKAAFVQKDVEGEPDFVVPDCYQISVASSAFPLNEPAGPLHASCCSCEGLFHGVAVEASEAQESSGRLLRERVERRDEQRLGLGVAVMDEHLQSEWVEPQSTVPVLAIAISEDAIAGQELEANRAARVLLYLFERDSAVALLRSG